MPSLCETRALRNRTDSHSGKPSFHKRSDAGETQNAVFKSLVQVPEKEGNKGLSLIMDVKLGQVEKESGCRDQISKCPPPQLKGSAASLLGHLQHFLGEATPALQALVIRSTQILSSFSVSPAICVFLGICPFHLRFRIYPSEPVSFLTGTR